MISISAHILINAPKDRVSRYLRDVRRLPEYDRKVAQASLSRQDEQTAELAAAGKLLRFSWKGPWRVEFTKDGGYRAHAVLGRLGTLNVDYQIRPVPSGTVLHHEERFHPTLLFKPLLLASKALLGQAVEWELRAIKEGAELLDRRIKLQEIESQV